ncbi:MAG: protein kinase, partial [Vicinamibacterales bacterium]
RAAQRVASIEHPSIAAVYACGNGTDGAFIASEFVPGQLLSAMVHGTPLHPRRALDLAAQLADGLAVAQEHGVTHGALTTASVIVTPRGTAKLLDVGLVPWTAAGADAPRDDRAGVGAVLFEMMVGRPLRTGWPAELRLPELPLDVRPVLQSLVAPRPGEAYESMATVAAVLRDLALVVTARTSAPAAELLPVTEPDDRGRSGTAVVVGLVVLLVLATLAWAFFRGMS